MAWGKKRKRVVKKGSLDNQRHLKWQGTVDHITLMAIVNAAYQFWTPTIVLSGRKLVLGNVWLDVLKYQLTFY